MTKKYAISVKKLKARERELKTQSYARNFCLSHWSNVRWCCYQRFI